MTDDLHTLAAAVVQSPHWRWLPGTAWIAVRERPLEDVAGRIDRSTPYPGAAPDLSDPATLGCLLALAREAWGDPGMSAVMTLNGEWMVLVAGGKPLLRVGRTVPRHPTEPAALVAALLTAPKE